MPDPQILSTFNCKRNLADEMKDCEMKVSPRINWVGSRESRVTEEQPSLEYVKSPLGSRVSTALCGLTLAHIISYQTLTSRH